MIKAKELLPLKDYIKGGYSPAGLKKQYPIFIDETAQLFDKIYVSAGVRETQMKHSSRYYGAQEDDYKNECSI